MTTAFDEDMFICPISLVIMQDPVQTTSGHTFERSAIEDWFRGHNTCPLTNEEIPNTLTPNFALRSVIETYLKGVEEEAGPGLLDEIPLQNDANNVNTEVLVWQESVMAHCHGRDTRTAKLYGGKYHVLFYNSNLFPLSFSQVHWKLLRPEGGEPIQSGHCELRNMPEVTKKCWFHIQVPEAEDDESTCELHMQFICCTWFSTFIKLGQARVNVSILRVD